MSRFMYWFTLILVSALLSFFVYQLICVLFNTYKMCKVIKRLEKIIDISKIMILSGIGQNMKEEEKITLNSSEGNLIICKSTNGAKIDGVEIDFQKDLLEQIKPISTELIAIISSYISIQILRNVLIARCKKIEQSAMQLQELIASNKMKGAKI